MDPLRTMSVPSFYMLVFGVSLALSLGLTPLARRLALRLGFVDAPAARKVHVSSTPYLGGAAIWVACMAAMLIRYDFLPHILAWAVGATILLMVGLWDDKSEIHPRAKLGAQVLAGAVVVLWGDSFYLTGFTPFDQALSLFWLVGLSNAVNLLDNMDGLSAGTTAVSCFFLFLIAALNGQYLVAALALSIVGACLGFLRYNFARPSATIFMGDAGSLFLGFTLAFAGIRLNIPYSGTWDFLIPVMVLGLPILDTTLVTLMRVRAGRPVSLGGKDHCSHRLVKLGYSQRQAVLMHYAVAAVFGTLGLAAFELAFREPLLGAALLAVLATLAARFFATVARVEVYSAPVAAPGGGSAS